LKNKIFKATVSKKRRSKISSFLFLV